MEDLHPGWGPESQVGSNPGDRKEDKGDEEEAVALAAPGTWQALAGLDRTSRHDLGVRPSSPSVF